MTALDPLHANSVIADNREKRAPMIRRSNAFLQLAWQENAPLTITTILMLLAFIGSCLGVVFDQRIITGAPAWLKPAKFAISTAIYTGTMVWLFGYITIWPRLIRAVGWVMSLILVVDVGILDIQAARGATSHFNVGTPVDATLFSIMGSFIALLWLTSMVVLVALFRQSFFNPSWGCALRTGMLLTVIGTGAGGMMLRPSPDQLEQIKITHRPEIFGAHTVGAPDGGPGLPGLAWSRSHGDLRIPHFFGLHGIQIIPFFAFLLGRGRLSTRQQTNVVLVAGSSYLALFLILSWQALRGQSIVQPDTQTVIALAVWLLGTVLTGALSLALTRSDLRQQAAATTALS